jgi:hypothetical protein
MARRSLGRFLVTLGLLALAAPAHAFFHEWDIKEVYSNADGSIQYVELYNPTAPFETVANGVRIVATSDGVSRTFTFVGNLTGNTANRHLLIATPGFAGLPGAVTPDYTLPCGPFFDPAATTISVAIESDIIPIIDSISFAGASLPTNGTNSLTDTTVNTPTTNLVSGPSSPTNYAGNAGALALTGCLQTGACDACDDGLYCNGAESCSASACVAGPGCIGLCDEDQDTCDLFDLIFTDGFDGPPGFWSTLPG